jgi:hypothetical protein
MASSDFSRSFAHALGAVALLSLLPATTRAADLVPYQATDWRYMQVANGDPLETVFMNPLFDDSGWSVGQAAFGNGGCYLDATVHTPWEPVTDMLLRRAFTADPLMAVTIHFAIDNDAVVWVNGTQVGSVAHDGCPNLDDYSLVVPPGVIVPGPNVLAFRAVDRGLVAYVDVRVEGELPVPAVPASWGSLKAIYR